ncbi:MAG: hypothetical protein JXR84_06565 [Anaerolineae bacterium]|nr:hypothetical protein [Anaerolineae bacterium]
MNEMDMHDPKKQETSRPETVDVKHTESVWETLMIMGEAIGRGWQSPLNSVELLSDMRR